MKFQQISPHITGYSGVGSKYYKEKTITSMVALDNNTTDPSIPNSLPPLSKINAYTAPHIAKVAIEALNEEEITAKNIALHNKKIDDANDLLKKLGIKGQVTHSSMQLVPQNYTMHYIEMTDKSKQNIIVVELENGEFVFAETPLDGKTFFDSFEKFSNNEKYYNKLNIDEFKKMFAEFCGVEKMKNLFDEFMDSYKNEINK